MIPASFAATRYRADIDGLRALAVLAIVFFHVGFERFRGGYVGVDVFFVISGFLITRLIRDEVLRTGSFSFRDFYIRRARRLFPSLFLTLVLSAGLALWLLSPQHLARFGRSLAAALAFSSNLFFWSESGYFDTDVAFKPLLHTWSLSVEEQFYLVWPVLLVWLLLKVPRHAPKVLILGGIASLAANMVVADGLGSSLGGIFSDGRSTIFYLAPFRVFEFAIGALVVWTVTYRPRHAASQEAFVALGLGMIGFSVFSYTPETVFPSVNALAPALGTALAIHGGPARLTGLLLNNPVSVGIGLISYSLYLIHWPVVVFHRYHRLGEIGRAEQFGICAFSIVAAVLMYRFVEQPFRQANPSRAGVSLNTFGALSAACAAMIVGVSTIIWATDGLRSRFPGELQQLIAVGDTVTRDDVLTWGLGECYLGGSFAESQAFPADFDSVACLQLSETKVNVVVIGDSSAADLMFGLKRVYQDINFIQITAASCRPIRNWTKTYACDRMIDLALDDFLPKQISNIHSVVLVGRWYGDPRTFARLRDTLSSASFIPREKLYVFGDQLHFKGGMSTAASLWGRTEGFAVFLESIRVKYERTSNRQLKEMVDPYAQFVEVHDYLCSPNCAFFVDGDIGDPITRDGNHLTPNGSVFFARQLRNGGFYF